MDFSHDGSNDLIVEMIEEERNVSTKPSCVAYYAAKDGNKSIQKMMFKMVKQ
jgi:hypothetical protein